MQTWPKILWNALGLSRKGENPQVVKEFEENPRKRINCSKFYSYIRFLTEFDPNLVSKHTGALFLKEIVKIVNLQPNSDRMLAESLF